MDDKAVVKENKMKIDLGCGEVKREGFIRVDNNPSAKPDILMDMCSYVKRLDKNSVDEAIIANSIEFLEGVEIFEFMNDLHEVIKPSGVAMIEVTCVTMPNGDINPKAWTSPLLKTHFSKDTFKCFNDYTTSRLRAVKRWKTRDSVHHPSGTYLVWMEPDK